MKKRHICKGYLKHKHRLRFAAQLCGFVQGLLNMPSIHEFFLALFKPKKLWKIRIAMKGRFRRATKRRIAKGSAPI